MRKFDILRFAMGNFLRRKARSALTVLGVIIGTAAVVIMLSIGIGMNKGFEDQISEWGDLRQISVREFYGSWDEETGEFKQNDARVPLDDIALDEIRAIKGVKAASPQQYSQHTSTLVKDRSESKYYPEVYGIDAASMADFGYEVLYGRLLDESDVGTTNFVMCYNIPFTFARLKADWGERDNWHYSTKDEELPFNPVGDDIQYEFSWQWRYGYEAVDTTKPRVINQPAKCVGILVQKLSGGNYDYSSEIYMDIKGMQEMDEKLAANEKKYNSSVYGDYGGYEEAVIYYGNGVEISQTMTTDDGRKSMYENLMVLVEDSKDVLDVQTAIQELGYEVNSSMDYLQRMQEQTAFLRAILGAIGVVAFIVAAISIANTMVMSIYERTREIGIMKVIGCKLKDIRMMFLVEAGIIGIVGGALGVGLSYGMSMLVNKLAASGGMSMMGIDAANSNLSIIPFWLDIAALILATAVGVVSGLYPAIRATMLSALEAIKNE